MSLMNAAGGSLTEAVEACSREYPGERSYYGPVAYTPDFSDFA